MSKQSAEFVPAMSGAFIQFKERIKAAAGKVRIPCLEPRWCIEGAPCDVNTLRIDGCDDTHVWGGLVTGADFMAKHDGVKFRIGSGDYKQRFYFKNMVMPVTK